MIGLARRSLEYYSIVVCFSIAESHLTLCDPMGCSTPGFPVLYHLLEVCSDSCPLSWGCYLTILSSIVPLSSCPQSFPELRYFPMMLFASGVTLRNHNLLLLNNQSASAEHLGCSKVFTFTNRAAINVHICGFGLCDFLL